MFALAFDRLLPGGERGRLHTLIFHRVLPQRDPLFPGEVTASDFDAICGWLKRWFNVLPLAHAIEQLRDGRLPRRALAISFDDGYADNHDAALPILQRHGLTATFFVATGFLDGGRMWNDTVIEAVRGSAKLQLDLTNTVAASLGALPLGSTRHRQDAISQIIAAVKYLPQADRQTWVQAIAHAAAAPLPDDLMMTSDQVRQLHRAGMGIGGHTVTHPILSRLDTPDVELEISDGRRQLESIVKAPVNLFAYPNGKPGADYDDRAVQIVRDLGFSAAMATTWGTAGGSSDMLQLPRFTPWDRSKFRFGVRLARQMLAG